MVAVVLIHASRESDKEKARRRFAPTRSPERAVEKEKQ
jgi:hypothetical protein